MTSLFILSGFSSQIKLNINLFNSLIIVLFGSGSDMNKWFSCDINNDLNTVILPNGVRFLFFQFEINDFNLASFLSKFNFGILWRFTSKSIPNRLNFERPHWRLYSLHQVSLLKDFEPIHVTCVFERLRFRPDVLPKLIISFIADDNDFSLPSSSKVVSSANWDSFISLLWTFIPLIILLFLIFKANISAQMIKSCDR